MGNPTPVIGGLVVWEEPDDRRKVLDGALQIAELKIGSAAVEIGIDVLRSQPETFGQAGHGLLEVSALSKRDAALEMHVRDLRVEGDRLLNILLPPLGLTSL